MRKVEVYSENFLYRVQNSLTTLSDVGINQPFFSKNVVVFFYRNKFPSVFRKVFERKVQMLYRVRDSIKWKPPIGYIPGDDSSAGNFLKKSDIVDNLTTNNSEKVLSAKQGFVLREMIEDQENSFNESLVVLSEEFAVQLGEVSNAAAECCETRRLEIIALREEFENFSSSIEVIDSFESTSTELPLSALRGKILWDLLSKLVPSSPAGISSIAFWNVSGFTAHRIDGGKNIPNIVYVSSIGNKSVIGIYNGESGILTFIAYRNSTEVMRAEVDIADAPLSTTNIDLASAYDPFEGQQGQGGFYKKIDAVFKPGTAFYSFTQGSPNRYQFRIEHTDPADFNESNVFEIDESPGGPSVTSFNITSLENNKRYVSGIPVYGAGNKVYFSSSADHLVSNFYNSTWIKNCTGSVLNSRDFTELDFDEINSYDQSLSLSSYVTIATNKYLKGDLIMTITGRNASGVTASRQASYPNVLIDSLTGETSRVKSDDGDFPLIYPAGECGDIYDSSQLLSLNQELLFLGGKVQYPNEDFTVYGGPDYTGLSGRRWFTKAFTGKRGTKVFIDFSGVVGFGSNPVLPSNIKLFIKCGQESNWISGHDPFSLVDPLSVVNSTLNGAYGLLVGESTITRKTITFGTVITNYFTLYVRVGFDEGCSASFTGFSAVTDM